MLKRCYYTVSSLGEDQGRDGTKALNTRVDSLAVGNKGNHRIVFLLSSSK